MRNSIHVPLPSPITTGDMGDKAVASYGQFVALGVASVLNKQQLIELEEAQLAAARRAGTQPKACKDCGDQISVIRLAVKPGAARCTDCQGKFENLGQWRPLH